MADIAKLGIEVTSKGVDAAKRSLTQLTNAADSTEKSTDSLTDSFSGLKKVAGALAGVLAIRELKEIGSQFVSVASDAAETQNKFSVVFGDIQQQAELTSDVLEQSYGMSDKAAKESLSAVGDLLTGLGLQQKAALDLSNQTVQLGTDLASFTNYAGGAKGATEALTKALLGETEQAKSLGLVLNETQMKEYAESVGKSWKELNLAEKAQLRLNAAIAQSPNALGDFARSSSELANQTRIANAVIEDMQTKMGQGLLPAVKDVITAFTGSREGLTQFAQVVGTTLNESLSGANGLLKNFTDETGKLKTTGLSELFIQSAGAVKLFSSGLNTAWLMVKQALSDAKRLVTLDLFDSDRLVDEAKEFEEALYQASLKGREGLRMLQEPAAFVERALKKVQKTAATTGNTLKNLGGAVSDTGTSNVTKVTKEQSNALQQVQDKLFELTHTAQQNEIYQVNQWYNAKAAVIGYTDELEKARKLEIQKITKTYDDKESKKQLAAEKANQQSILNNELATAQERIAVINSMYDSKVAAAEKYGLSTVSLEAERSLKIQEIWDQNAVKHGDMIDGFISGTKEYTKEAQTEYQRAKTAGLTMARSLESGLNTFFDVTGKGWEDWGNTATNVINDVLNAILQATVVSPLTDSIVSGIGGISSSLFSGSSGTTNSSWMNNQSWSARATGAAFSSGISQYSGSVVSSPTFFQGNDIKAYATGGNIMGEAGPEAILPLTRTSGGDLGVKTSSSSSNGSITINITNTGEAVEAEATTSQDSRGNTSLDVILTPLKKEIANDIATNGTLLNRASKSAAGLQDAINPNVSRGF